MNSFNWLDYIDKHWKPPIIRQICSYRMSSHTIHSHRFTSYTYSSYTFGLRMHEFEFEFEFGSHRFDSFSSYDYGSFNYFTAFEMSGSHHDNEMYSDIFQKSFPFEEFCKLPKTIRAEMLNMYGYGLVLI